MLQIGKEIISVTMYKKLLYCIVIYFTMGMLFMINDLRVNIDQSQSLYANSYKQTNRFIVYSLTLADECSKIGKGIIVVSKFKKIMYCLFIYFTLGLLSIKIAISVSIDQRKGSYANSYKQAHISIVHFFNFR